MKHHSIYFCISILFFIQSALAEGIYRPEPKTTEISSHCLSYIENIPGDQHEWLTNALENRTIPLRHISKKLHIPEGCLHEMKNIHMMEEDRTETERMIHPIDDRREEPNIELYDTRNTTNPEILYKQPRAQIISYEAPRFEEPPEQIIHRERERYEEKEIMPRDDMHMNNEYIEEQPVMTQEFLNEEREKKYNWIENNIYFKNKNKILQSEQWNSLTDENRKEYLASLLKEKYLAISSIDIENIDMEDPAMESLQQIKKIIFFVGQLPLYKKEITERAEVDFKKVESVIEAVVNALKELQARYKATGEKNTIVKRMFQKQDESVVTEVVEPAVNDQTKSKEEEDDEDKDVLAGSPLEEEDIEDNEDEDENEEDEAERDIDDYQAQLLALIEENTNFAEDVNEWDKYNKNLLANIFNTNFALSHPYIWGALVVVMLIVVWEVFVRMQKLKIGALEVSLTKSQSSSFIGSLIKKFKKGNNTKSKK
jgi:hypothetical protein